MKFTFTFHFSDLTAENEVKSTGPVNLPTGKGDVDDVVVDDDEDDDDDNDDDDDDNDDDDDVEHHQVWKASSLVD